MEPDTEAAVPVRAGDLQQAIEGLGQAVQGNTQEGQAKHDRALESIRDNVAARWRAERRAADAERRAEAFGELREALERTEGKVDAVHGTLGRFWAWCKRWWPGQREGKGRMDYSPMWPTLDKYLAAGESIEAACSDTLRDFEGSADAKALAAFIRAAYREGKRPIKGK